MVEYRTRQNSSLNDDFSTSLRETYNYFSQQEKVSILGEGISDILSDPQLFETYTEKLLEGTSGTDYDDVKKLMENARMNTFLESATSGISPVASFTFPIIRKLWARTGVVKAFPTEVVKSNAFSVAFNRPYIETKDGKKKYLPEALDEEGALDSGKAKLVNPEGGIALPATGYNLFEGFDGATREIGDTVDRDFAITKVVIDGTEYKVPRNQGKLDINDKIYIEIPIKDEDGKTVKETKKVFAFVNLDRATMDCTSLDGSVTAVYIDGKVASDAHNRATNISFDLVRKDFTIGTGEHFEASLPVEFLQDAMATYQIDGTTEVVDIMSNVISHKLEQEIIAFFDGVYDTTNDAYYGEFDLRPSISYAMSPKEWREELKTVIDHLAIDMKTKNHAQQCYFVLFAHPLDAQLIPNVNWTFDHTVETNAGVEVEYNLGATSGLVKYVIVSSELVPQGAIRVLLVPTTDTFKTLKYYPYTFNVINNYLNTQRSNVPNIVMTKRHTMEEFLPWVGRIEILNNTRDMLKNLSSTIDSAITGA